MVRDIRYRSKICNLFHLRGCDPLNGYNYLRKWCTIAGHRYNNSCDKYVLEKSKL